MTNLLCLYTIKDTNYKIRRDDYIYPKDPLVKELVKRYLARQDSQLKAFIKANDIRHPSNANIAGMQFNLADGVCYVVKKPPKFTTHHNHHQTHRQRACRLWYVAIFTINPKIILQ